MARFRGKCGGADDVKAVFDKKMSVEVYVKNKGDCPVRIQFAEGVPDPMIPGATELRTLKRSTVQPGSAKSVFCDGVTDVRIYCGGDEDDGDCIFRYTIDAD